MQKARSCSLLLLLVLAWLPHTGRAADDSYHSPLAGAPYRTSLLGERIEVAPRDRANTFSLTLGGTLYAPSLGSTDALPVAALYWRKETETYRSRLIFSIFANEWDLACKLNNGWELLGRLENVTDPFPQEEVVDGRALKRTSVVWGNAAAWLGLGYRLPVAPLQTDNDLRLQLFYTGGYLYSDYTSDTGRNVQLPPDSWVSGLHARIRYDGLQRNIMELPHTGFAMGADLEWAYRHHWSDANYGGALFKAAETRQYTKVSAYALAALPVPGLSEKNRLVASVYGGTAPEHDLDRFSAFRIGGGPFPNETDDLWRVPYPGALFNQFPVADYVVGTLEYRRELLFFLYLHLRGTIAWINRDVLTNRRIKFSEDRGEAFSAGLTSGLPWNSSIYVEYAHDTGILRNGKPGDGVMLLWSKTF